MKPDSLPTLLILTQREHQRLNNQIKRLLTYALDEQALKKYRDSWINNLGFTDDLPLLIQAVDHLIDLLEHGEYEPEAYAEVVTQLELYKQSSWSFIRSVYGSISPYVDRWLKVKPEYKEAFKQRYEAHRKLTVDEQKDVVRSILATIPSRRDPYNLKQGSLSKRLLRKLGIVAVETTSDLISTKGKVIDFLSFKNRKQK